MSTGTSVLCSYVTALSSLRSASRVGLVGLSVCVRLSRKSHALLCRLLRYLLKKMISFIVFSGMRKNVCVISVWFSMVQGRLKGRGAAPVLVWWSSALYFSQLLPEKALCLC